MSTKVYTFSEIVHWNVTVLREIKNELRKSSHTPHVLPRYPMTTLGGVHTFLLPLDSYVLLKEVHTIPSQLISKDVL